MAWDAHHVCCLVSPGFILFSFSSDSINSHILIATHRKHVSNVVSMLAYLGSGPASAPSSAFFFFLDQYGLGVNYNQL